MREGHDGPGAPGGRRPDARADERREVRLPGLRAEIRDEAPDGRQEDPLQRLRRGGFLGPRGRAPRCPRLAIVMATPPEPGGGGPLATAGLKRRWSGGGGAARPRGAGGGSAGG